MTTTYSIKKRSDTEELHLFEGQLNPPNSETKCTSESNSICGKMKWEKGTAGFSCETDEKTVRQKCAEMGRKVCGICVSSLYADYK